MALVDPELWPFLTAWFERADALLLGRRIWQIHEPTWSPDGSSAADRPWKAHATRDGPSPHEVTHDPRDP